MENDKKPDINSGRISNFMKVINPLISHRWMLIPEGVKIDSYLFRKYKFYGDNDGVIFTTEIMETVENIFNPEDFFKIKSFRLYYTNSIGVSIGHLFFDVVGSNFEKDGNMNSNDLNIYKMKFIVKPKSVKVTYEKS